MGWTNLSTWDGNFQDLAFLNEYVSALRERQRAFGNLRIKNYTSGSPGAEFTQSPTIYDLLVNGNSVQQWLIPFHQAILVLLWEKSSVEAMYPYTLPTDGSDKVSAYWAATVDINGNAVSNFDGYPLTSGDSLGEIAWTPSRFFPHVTGESTATGFRRYTKHPSQGGTLLYGPAQSGDIIGKWIFEDLQAAFGLMTRTLHKPQWSQIYGGNGHVSRDFGANGRDPSSPSKIRRSSAFTSLAAAQSSWTSASIIEDTAASALSQKVVVESDISGTKYWRIYSQSTAYAFTYSNTTDASATDKWDSGPGVNGAIKIYFAGDAYIYTSTAWSSWDAQDMVDCLHTWKVMQSASIASTDHNFISSYVGDLASLPTATPAVPGLNEERSAGWMVDFQSSQNEDTTNGVADCCVATVDWAFEYM